MAFGGGAAGLTDPGQSPVALEGVFLLLPRSPQDVNGGTPVGGALHPALPVRHGGQAADLVGQPRPPPSCGLAGAAQIKHLLHPAAESARAQPVLGRGCASAAAGHVRLLWCSLRAKHVKRQGLDQASLWLAGRRAQGRTARYSGWQLRCPRVATL